MPDGVVGVADLASGGFEPVERVGDLGCLAAEGQDQGLHAPHRAEVEHVPARLVAGGELAGQGEDLLVLTRFDERVERACHEVVGEPGEAASLRESDTRP